MILKRALPKSLFGRVLLILVLPMVLLQLVMVYIFIDRHWENVTRHMAGTLTGEVAFFIRQLEAAPPQRHVRVETDFEDASGIDVSYEPQMTLPEEGNPEFREFREHLHAKIANPFNVRKSEDGGTLEIRVALEDRIVLLQTTIKRLESHALLTLLAWMLGASALFLLIAILFLRNQIRPIRRLAIAADSFGRGVDMPGFRPHGATEVRKAAKAFIIMRERIKRQLRTRTEMLAGISHDLRTPLTRMKLELAMLAGNKEAIKELEEDVEQMERMIQEYLDFARGEGREEAVKMDLRTLLEEVVADYARQHADVSLHMKRNVTMDIRASGFRRMLHNLIDNALRYGKRCDLRVKASDTACEILIDDEGPGIPEDKRHEVFKPFNRLESSRNSKTGGVGLGLTIARDIVLAHGGAISLAQAPAGGLRVVVRLPL